MYRSSAAEYFSFLTKVLPCHSKPLVCIMTSRHLRCVARDPWFPWRFVNRVASHVLCMLRNPI